MAFKRWSGGGVGATAILDGVCARCHWAQAGRDGETALRSNKETGPKDRKILGQHTTFLTKCPIQGWAKAAEAWQCRHDFAFRLCPRGRPEPIAEAKSDGVGKGAPSLCTRHRLYPAPLPTLQLIATPQNQVLPPLRTSYG